MISLKLDFSIYRSYNEIESLTDNVFIDLIKLDDLNLSNNKLTALNRRSFGLLGRLERLNVEKNGIPSIDTVSLFYLRDCEKIAEMLSAEFFKTL